MFWGGRCGVAWNSLFLAVLVGFITTILGLVFALVVTRSGFRYKRLLRTLTVLPIITPPFVIGLALILLFGLSGSVTTFISDIFGTQPTRWLLWHAWNINCSNIGFHTNSVSGSYRGCGRCHLHQWKKLHKH